MTAYITRSMLLLWQSSMAAVCSFSFLARKFTPLILRSSRYTINSHHFRKASPIANTFQRAFSLQSPKMSKAFIQKPAPGFSGTAVNKYGEFIDIKLSDYAGKYLVLFFYPLDFTFVCPTEILDFSKKAEEFRAINCELVACSVDSQYSHLAWTNVEPKKGGLGHINIPLLSDITKQISKDYGVLLEDQGVALRGLFIIDDKGILRQITVNDLPVGRSADEVLRLVQAFQYTDKHGEVCPAGWRPGGDTIVPDTKKSADYFSKQ